jgi:hypothetical protein
MAKSVETAFLSRADDPKPVLEFPHPKYGHITKYEYTFDESRMTQKNLRSSYTCRIRRGEPKGLRI